MPVLGERQQSVKLSWRAEAPDDGEARRRGRSGEMGAGETGPARPTTPASPSAISEGCRQKKQHSCLSFRTME